MSKTLEIARKRKMEIEYSSKRILKKLNDSPKSIKAPLWQKRLEEYLLSMELIDFTIKTGRKVLLKGDEADGGLTISPPNGFLAAGGSK